jgi:hypothetical protein
LSLVWSSNKIAFFKSNFFVHVCGKERYSSSIVR